MLWDFAAAEENEEYQDYADVVPQINADGGAVASGVGGVG